jgi:4-amino-4-deoxy-L-arabinose transferase-like glycosyltransferase
MGKSIAEIGGHDSALTGARLEGIMTVKSNRETKMAASKHQFPEHGGSPGTPRNDVPLILCFAFGVLAFHLLVNAFGGYGIFRDEYYYIACSKRPAAGYVDQPPLAMFLMAAGRALFGVSQLGIRVLPALSHALTVILGGFIGRRLGGRRAAVLLTCFAVALAPLVIGHTHIFQMNAFAHLFWVLAAYLLVLIVDRSRPGLWVLLGIVMGLGLLNKIDFLWFGVGLAAALVLTDLRKHLATPWPYAAAGIALGRSLPLPR